MNPTSRVTWALLVVTFPYSEASNFPEAKPYLSDHQDAWRAMKQNRPFVMYQRSFEQDPSFFGGQKCIQGIMVEFYPEEKYAVGVIHWLPSQDKKVNETAYLFPKTTEGYRIPNAYVSSPNSGRLLNTQYTFVVSEYDNCDILRVRHRNNGCELWSLMEKVNEISSLCHFIYDLLCGPEKYIIYDPETCGKVPLWLQ